MYLKNYFQLIGLVGLCFFWSCQKESTVESVNDENLKALLMEGDNDLASYMLPSSTDYNNIPSDPKNPITKEKVELGLLVILPVRVFKLGDSKESQKAA